MRKFFIDWDRKQLKKCEIKINRIQISPPWNVIDNNFHRTNVSTVWEISALKLSSFTYVLR